MQVPRLEVKLELQQTAYATARATPDASHTCNLCHSVLQCQILNPLNKARDWTHNFMDTRWVLNLLNHNGNASIFFFFKWKGQNRNQKVPHLWNYLVKITLGYSQSPPPTKTHSVEVENIFLTVDCGLECLKNTSLGNFYLVPCGSSHCGARGLVASLGCWDTGLIPCPARWVKDPTLYNCRWGLILGLGTPYISRWPGKKKKKKKKKKKVLGN